MSGKTNPVKRTRLSSVILETILLIFAFLVLVWGIFLLLNSEVVGSLIPKDLVEVLIATPQEQITPYPTTPSVQETPTPIGIATPTATSTPKPISTLTETANTAWWRVYFVEPSRGGSPNDISGTLTEVFITLINEAQRSIHLAVFEFNLTPVAEALVAAKKRGVEVRWVTDDEYGLGVDGEPGRGQFAFLKNNGIEVRSDGRKALMHNKFVIFDGEVVWTGSTNLTANDHFRNNNNVILIYSPPVAQIYENEFNEMWEGQFGPASPSQKDFQNVRIQNTPVEILFAPEDGVIERLITLVNQAKVSIHFMAFSFAHPRLGQAMVKRAQEGVEVRGIFERRGSETMFSELGRLFCAGLAVRQDGNPATFHHKVLILDERIVVTGSLNFSENADRSNDENVIILFNRTIARQYLQEFERRWNEASVPSSQSITCP